MVMYMKSNIDIEVFNMMMLNACLRPRTDITVDFILNCWCEFSGTNKMDALSDSQRRPYVIARQVTMFYSKNLTKLSYGEIGNRLGGLDRATCMHGVRQIGNLIETDAKFKNILKSFERGYNLDFNYPSNN